jgi:hypothetical protein
MSLLASRFPRSMELKASLSYSQRFAPGQYLQPGESNPHPSALIDILVLSSRLYSYEKFSLFLQAFRLKFYTYFYFFHFVTVVAIKRSIKHHPLPSQNNDFLQATCWSVEDSTGPLTVSAVYLPPRHTVKQVQLAAFYSTLGRRFIAGGGYNAKHTD